MDVFSEFDEMSHEGYDRPRDDRYESSELRLQNAISEIFLENHNLKQNLVSRHYPTDKQIKVLC